MKTDLLRIVILVVVCAVPFSIAPAAPICDCFYYPNHLRAFRESKAVFIGEVTKVERHPERPDGLATQVTQAITFQGDKKLEGKEGSGEDVGGWVSYHVR